jgi:hypothetical protein
MPSSGTCRRVAHLRTDVSEERIASITRVKIYKDKYIVFHRSVLQFLVTANVVPSSPILSTLMMEAIPSERASVASYCYRS